MTNEHDATEQTDAADAELETAFRLPKMDCSAEEALVRMKLEGAPGIASLSFDLASRRVVVRHTGEPRRILRELEGLRLGAELLHSNRVSGAVANTSNAERRTLWTLLAINTGMFAVELAAGLIAQSAGLIADSLDMFADAAVYGLSLYAVGRAAALKLRAAHFSGWIQIALAFGVLLEVTRRTVLGSEPEATLMILVAMGALVANVGCLLLIARHRHAGPHMRASWIFSSNDVLANAGVILAGLLVSWRNSAIPDLAIGTIIGVLVLAGGVRILGLR